MDNDGIRRHHLFHIGGRRLAGDVIGGDHAFELAIGGDDRKFAVPGLQAQLLPVANGVDGLQHIGIGGHDVGDGDELALLHAADDGLVDGDDGIEDVIRRGDHDDLVGEGLEPILRGDAAVAGEHHRQIVAVDIIHELLAVLTDDHGLRQRFFLAQMGLAGGDEKCLRRNIALVGAMQKLAFDNIGELAIGQRIDGALLFLLDADGAHLGNGGNKPLVFCILDRAIHRSFADVHLARKLAHGHFFAHVQAFDEFYDDIMLCLLHVVPPLLAAGAKKAFAKQTKASSFRQE